MNRVIRFRAWHTTAKKMLNGSNTEIFRWQEEGQPIVIMQFTGLLDKNGKEIYEDDVVSVPYITPLGSLTSEENYKAPVHFKNGYYFIHGYEPKSTVPLHHWCNVGKTEYIPNYGEIHEELQETHLMVVGNIYENPELLTA